MIELSSEMESLDIDSLEAGPELDRLVAERVMGWNLVDLTWYCNGNPTLYHNYYPDPDCGELPWNPSENISAAWKVAEEIIGLKKPIRKFEVVYLPGEGWGARIYEPHWNNPLAPGNDTALEIQVRKQDTAPLAIVRAALKAMEGK